MPKHSPSVSSRNISPLTKMNPIQSLRRQGCSGLGFFQHLMRPTIPHAVICNPKAFLMVCLRPQLSACSPQAWEACCFCLASNFTLTLLSCAGQMGAGGKQLNVADWKSAELHTSARKIQSGAKAQNHSVQLQCSPLHSQLSGQDFKGASAYAVYSLFFCGKFGKNEGFPSLFPHSGVRDILFCALGVGFLYCCNIVTQAVFLLLERGMSSQPPSDHHQRAVSQEHRAGPLLRSLLILG